MDNSKLEKYKDTTERLSNFTDYLEEKYLKKPKDLPKIERAKRVEMTKKIIASLPTITLTLEGLTSYSNG